MRFAAPLSFVLLAVALVFIARSQMGEPPAPIAEAVPVQDAFGVEVQQFTVSKASIQFGDTFSGLLAPYGVGGNLAHEMAEKARPVFDVRDLRAGRELVVYQTADSLQDPKLAVYEVDPTTYYVFDFRDSLSVTKKLRAVSTRTNSIRGTISSSLYETLISAGADPYLAVKMSEVYAWQIDFYRLQKGDLFTVAYEERFVGQRRVGLGDVLAAEFHHGGRVFEAYLYGDDEKEYYDGEANSLRKAFLIAPVEYSRISSGYSGRRFHPVQKRYKAHLGTDYAAPRGTPIHATGEGKVTDARYGRANGNYVKIRHNATYTTQYLHMTRIAGGIRPGVSVKQGQVIGYVGSTGLANGPHVCYRFWKNNEQVDHLREDLPSVEPLPSDEHPSFYAHRDQWRRHLDAPSEVVGPPAVAAQMPPASVRAADG